MKRVTKKTLSRASKAADRWPGLRVLLLDDEKSVLSSMQDCIAPAKVDIEQIYRGADLMPALKSRKPQLLICDMTFNERVVGPHLIAAVRQSYAPQELAIFIHSGRQWTQDMGSDAGIWGEIGFFSLRMDAHLTHAFDMAHRYFIKGDKAAMPVTPISKWPKQEVVQPHILRQMYEKEARLRGD